METPPVRPRLQNLITKASIIGIDIDGVLSDTIGATIKEIRKRFGYVMNIENWKTWNSHQIAELQAIGITTIQDTIDLFYSILKPGWSQETLPVPGSKEWIQWLLAQQKKLIALSGRMESSRPYTTDWLTSQYPWAFQKILLTDHDTPKQVPKYELAHQYGIELMIEDNAHYAIDLATHGIPTILIDMPWNREVDTSRYPDIYRVKDWNSMR